MLVNKLRILLVEDDALIGLLLEELLSALGHAVVEIAATEQAAVAAAARLSPDLMIVDVTLARGDGISAMRAILAARAMPHIFMTGARSGDLPAGSIALRKPFQERHLVAALELAAARTGHDQAA